MSIQLTRRGFLSALASVAAAVIVTPAAKLWVPEEAKLILPPEASAAAVSGRMICGWIFPSGYEPDNFWLAADAWNFPRDVPLMILSRMPYTWETRRGSRAFRFIYKGSGDPEVDGQRVPVTAAWSSAASIIK